MPDRAADGIARRNRRRDIPDEEGTESTRRRNRRAQIGRVAETSPMRRGLKVRSVGVERIESSGVSGRRDIPDEEGTERRKR